MVIEGTERDGYLSVWLSPFLNSPLACSVESEICVLEVTQILQFCAA